MVDHFVNIQILQHDINVVATIYCGCIKIDTIKNHFIYTNSKNKYPTFIIYYYYRHNKIQIKT